MSDINESILRKLGYSWLDERSLPEQWWNDPELRSFRAELIQVLKDDLAGSELWAIKDPRMCRLLPFWLEILTEIECQPCFLIITRDPSEVALSLSRRDNIRPWKSALLWLRYLLDAECYSRGYPRVFLTYEDLLINWRGKFESVAQEFSIEWPITPAEICTELTRFLDTNLRHHQARDNALRQDSDIDLATDTYNLINQDLKGFQDKQPILMVKLERAIEQHEDCLASVNEYLLTIDKQQQQVRAIEEVRNALEHEIERIKSTVSWRITAPLRVAWNFYQQLFAKPRDDTSIK
ncbi:MAG: hypothetical protein ABW168_13870 [Sedimenticola sp.]